MALSSTEVEYRGADLAMCEAIWLKRLLQGLHVQVIDPIPIYCNNMRSIQVAKNHVFHARTKHIEVRYHFVWECVLNGKVELWFIRTDQQAAGIFTKALVLDKLR